MKQPKEIKSIYFFAKKNKYFKNWKLNLEKFLDSKYKFKPFYDYRKFLEEVLFNPPSLILYYYPKYPEGLEELVDFRKKLNLFNISIIIIVEKLDYTFLLSLSELIDDFIILDEPPERIALRIEYNLLKSERLYDYNPLTRLPGNLSIMKEIERVMKSEKPYVVCYADLDNFKAYNDVYGFTKGDEMIKNLARVLLNTLYEFSPDDVFLGHVGGDDFIFIVPLEKAEEVSQEIISRFNTLLPLFINDEDKKRGYLICRGRDNKLREFPFPSLSIAIIPIYKGKFHHIGEVSERLAECKNVAKRMEGSVYFVDRRR